MLAQAHLNHLWSTLIIQELIRAGVSEICIAPGSRSTPLTLSAAAQKELNLHTHFDERGLGFLALGLAKASKKPVAVIVTSGTAVANLLPAVAESKLTGERLILLTADRPIELIDCGANQAISQEGIFGVHVNASVNLCSPDQRISPAWLLTKIDAGLAQQVEQGGSLHINCPFPEPLYKGAITQEAQEQEQLYLAPLAGWQKSKTLFVQCQRPRAYEPSLCSNWPADWAQRRGVIIAGALSLSEAQAVKKLAQRLGWVLLCDPQSGMSSDWAHYDLWLQSPSAYQALSSCQHVLQFGSRVVSKRLTHWLSTQHTQLLSYDYISLQPAANNPHYLSQTHWVMEVETWIQRCLANLDPALVVHHPWSETIKSYAQRCAQGIEQHLAQTADELTEIKVAQDLTQHYEPQAVFLGNSLGVRLVDMFGAFQQQAVYTNRGASGIDGLVATAAGVQRIIQAPLLMLIGDTALLYDLNSLVLWRDCQQACVIVVLNNNGGAIFDLLPVPTEQREALYQMPHNLTFAHAAQQFGLSYAQPHHWQDYQQRLTEHFSSGTGCLLLEVITPAQQTSEQLAQWAGDWRAL